MRGSPSCVRYVWEESVMRFKTKGLHTALALLLALAVALAGVTAQALAEEAVPEGEVGVEQAEPAAEELPVEAEEEPDDAELDPEEAFGGEGEEVEAQDYDDADYDIGHATIADIPDQTYTGGRIKPELDVAARDGYWLFAGIDYEVTYEDNVRPGWASATVRGISPYYGSQTVYFQIVRPAETPSVLYRVHRQTYGWEASWRRDGQQSGTTGQSKRLEGICIKLSNTPVSGGITYRTHVQKIGWQGWKSNGAMSGTSGKSLRLEAIQIKLTGEMAERYDVRYRVHAQHFGWMGWAKNGAQSGTAGYAYRLEAIQIKLVSKGGGAPGSTSGAFRERKVPAVSTSYVGTYKREVYTTSGTYSYAGYLPAGSLYSTSTLQIKSISGNKVTFKYSYVNANMATVHGTRWVTATIKNSRANFRYTSDENYGYEYGSGYLKFTNGKVIISVSTEYYTTGMRYTLTTHNGPMTMKKGTQRFYS